MLSMLLACWTARAAAVHARLRAVGMYGGPCYPGEWCIGSLYLSQYYFRYITMYIN